MLRANVFITNTPLGKQLNVGMSMNALDDADSRRSGGSTLQGILGNISPKFLRFPGNELADNYLYFKSPYTDPATHTVIGPGFPANVPDYFASGTLNANVLGVGNVFDVAVNVKSNVILSVSCVPSVAVNRDELANVAEGLVNWCSSRGFSPIYELSDPNASDIANRMRAADPNVVIYTKGVGNVLANGFWAMIEPLSNVRAFGSDVAGNWFGNYISSGVSVDTGVRNFVNSTLVKTRAVYPTYIVASAADTTRLVSAEGWTNVNDWGRGLISADIIDSMSRYTDAVIWSSTRATARPGGNYGNTVYSCLTNTNGYFPVGRAIQILSQTVNTTGRGWCPTSIDTNLIGAMTFTDAYIFGLKQSGNLGVVLVNKSNSNYIVDVHHSITRPRNLVFSRQLIPSVLSNTTTLNINYVIGNVSPNTNFSTTSVMSNAYTITGMAFSTGKKITSPPILVCPVDDILKTATGGVWNTSTIAVGKPTGISGYRDLKLSNIRTFTDPATGIKSNVIAGYYEQHSGGHLAANLLRGGFSIASNPNVFPRSNLAVFGDIYYDSDYDFGRGGKTGFGLFVGQQNASGGNYKVNSSSARCIFRANGESSMYLYLPKDLEQKYPEITNAAFANTSYGVEFFHRDTFKAVGGRGTNIPYVYDTPLRKNCWNEIGIGIRVNTFLGNGFPNYDGSCFMSINGVAREMTGLRWLANTGNVYDGVSHFVMNTFYGGSWTCPANSFAYYSNVRYHNYDVINELARP